jgi:predicted ABC-type sugar transport system permease subunit
LLFIGYGFLLSISWPIIISNAFIFLINIYYILKKNKK